MPDVGRELFQHVILGVQDLKAGLACVFTADRGEVFASFLVIFIFFVLDLMTLRLDDFRGVFVLKLQVHESVYIREFYFDAQVLLVLVEEFFVFVDVFHVGIVEFNLGKKNGLFFAENVASEDLLLNRLLFKS